MKLWHILCKSFFVLVITALVTKASMACSLPDDYKGPESNFELVQQADTILIGTLVKPVGNDIFNQKILVKPSILLKGPRLPSSVFIAGMLSDQTIKLPDNSALQPRATKSEPLDLWRPNPEVWIGGCSRQTFNPGMQIVLFFKAEGNELQQFDPAFMRSSEDVSGPDSLWVRAIKIYARISQLPLAKQKPTLRVEMLRLRNESFGDQERTLLADDIERQLAKVRPISDFSDGRATADEIRWMSNIANQTYHSRVETPKKVTVSNRLDASLKLRWLAFGSFIVATIAFIVILLRQRKRNVLRNRLIDISH